LTFERAVDDLVGRLVKDPGQVDAGVVENDVQPAPALDRGVGVGAHLLGVGDVGGHGKRGVADLVRRHGGRLAVDVNAGDPGALLDEPDGGGLADAGTRPGDDPRSTPGACRPPQRRRDRALPGSIGATDEATEGSGHGEGPLHAVWT
jgi:hypothetical protein